MKTKTKKSENYILRHTFTSLTGILAPADNESFVGLCCDLINEHIKIKTLSEEKDLKELFELLFELLYTLGNPSVPLSANTTAMVDDLLKSFREAFNVTNDFSLYCQIRYKICKILISSVKGELSKSEELRNKRILGEYCALSKFLSAMSDGISSKFF